jgi:hypothetical protein
MIVSVVGPAMTGEYPGDVRRSAVNASPPTELFDGRADHCGNGWAPLRPMRLDASLSKLPPFLVSRDEVL